MLAPVTDLITLDSANTYWQAPTPYLLSEGEFRSGGRTYEINTYWRDGMCEEAHVEGRCPSGPGEALIDPLMLKTLGPKSATRSRSSSPPRR